MSKRLFGDRVVYEWLPRIEKVCGEYLAEDSWLYVPVNVALLCSLPAFVLYSLAVKGDGQKHIDRRV